MASPRSNRPLSWIVCVGWQLLLTALLTSCKPGNWARHVELVASSPAPGMTFEVRFEETMVDADHLGVTTNCPLIISPPVTGTFTWISPRSGIFRPTKPLALDTHYSLTLSPTFLRADGRPMKARLRHTLNTPSLTIIASTSQRTDGGVSCEPEIALAFNADVDASAVQPFVTFRDANGRTIAADVCQGIELSREQFPWRTTLRTWRQEFGAPVESAYQPTNPLPNLIVALPRTSLPIGSGWRLMLNRGLPAVEQRLRLQERIEIPLGDVLPFKAMQVTAQNMINSGPSIQVTFSKPVSDSVTNALRKWIELSPEPTNVVIRVSDRVVRLSGDLHGGTIYEVKINRGLPAVEPVRLINRQNFSVAMPFVAPRLYFANFAADQLSAGKRVLPIMGINVPEFRLRAKLLDPATAIHALRGYGSYFVPYEERHAWYEPFRSINYELVPGRTIYDEKLPMRAIHDSADCLDLEWSRILGGRTNGLVFVDARAVQSAESPKMGAQALVQLTDLGLVWKRGGGVVEVFIFSYRNAKPIAGASVRLSTEENQVLSEASTDSNGRAQLRSHAKAEWIAAQLDDDFHARPLESDRLGAQATYVASNAEQNEAARKVLLFSERDVYRPGEVVFLKAIVRDWTDQGLAIPIGARGTLSCSDARGDTFLQTNVVLSSSGSWTLPFRLPSSSRGAYRARLEVGATDQVYHFEVQDFQANSFEVQLGAKSVYTPEEKFEVPVAARYYFGKSLTQAQVNWYLSAEGTGFYPEGFTDFKFFCNEDWRFRRGCPTTSRNGLGVLTSTSNLVITSELAINTNAPKPRSGSLLVEVTDLNQQTISQRAHFVQHSFDFYIGLRRNPNARNGTPAFDAIAIRTDGEPWPEMVKARMQLQRVEWQSVRVQGAGRTLRYHNEPTLTNVVKESVQLFPVQKAGPGQSLEAGALPLPDGLLPGDYLLALRAEDAAGRPVLSSTEFTVSGPAEVAWGWRNEVQLELKPGKETYSAGEIAEIAIEAPFSGTALVTVEREKVVRSFVTRLEGNAPSIKVPLEPGDVPNVYVSLLLIRGADECMRKVKEPEYRFGYCQLAVNDPQSRLSVDITTSATRYRPAETVETTVQITDNRGLPVKDAEVTLFAVDEGILSLSGFAVPDPHGFFYSARPLAVRSSASLTHLMSEDPDEWSFENKGYLGGGGGKIETRVRKNFLPCAFWQASLQSDADGKASARFAAPDGLTRYRLMAVAHHGAKCFGSSQAEFEVFKPLIIEPALPSFANISDSISACAIVQNQTEKAGDVIVSLQLDDKAAVADGSLTQRIAISAKGSARVQFPVRFAEAGPTTWVWQARFADPAAADYIDAVQSTLPVGNPAPMLHGVVLSRMMKGETNLLAKVDPQLLSGRGTLTITIANTRLSELAEAAAELLQYPYGCVEQTSSRLLPWIVLQDAPFVGTSHHATNELETPIDKAIKRLFSMQTDSGGLGYWPGAREPMLWGSAYAALVLAFAKQQGSVIPDKEYTFLLNYLGKQLRSSSNDDSNLEDRCLALFALAAAGRSESALHEQLFTWRQKLSADHRALLALAIIESQGSSEMIRDLLDIRPRIKPGDHCFASGGRTKAIRLLALTRFRTDDPTLEKAVEDLMREQADGHWQTTQGDAWALLALSEYSKRIESKSSSAAGSLTCGGSTQPFQLNEKTQSFTWTLSFTNLAHPLILMNSSGGRVYSTVSITSHRANLNQPRVDRGFSLQRWYDRLDDSGELQGTKNLRVGDRVLVTVRLQVPRDSSYLVVDDALPSILEAINPQFKTQETRPTASSFVVGKPWMADFHELRTDRCLSFANSVPAGDYVWRYLARVRAVGTVTAPAAKAEEMYHPNNYGLSGTCTLSSAEMN